MSASSCREVCVYVLVCTSVQVPACVCVHACVYLKGSSCTEMCVDRCMCVQYVHLYVAVYIQTMLVVDVNAGTRHECFYFHQLVLLWFEWVPCPHCVRLMRLERYVYKVLPQALPTGDYRERLQMLSGTINMSSYMYLTNVTFDLS